MKLVFLHARVARTVQRLEDMPARERDRWLELLSYIRVMVYHDRKASEQENEADDADLLPRNPESECDGDGRSTWNY